MKEKTKKQALQAKLGSLLSTLALVIAVVICLSVIIQVTTNGYVQFGGYSLFRVVTGSMEPTIPTGALLIAQEVDIATIRMDDIICFRTQLSEIWGKIVTHRVIGVMGDQAGQILLETKGDANLVSDIYMVDESNFVGKVVWHTGDDSLLAGIFRLFTSKIGFLGCIVLPTLLIAGTILKDSVSGIQKDMLALMEESQKEAQVVDWENDPLCGMTQEEYDEMYERIKAELMEELMQIYGEILAEVQSPVGDADKQ